KKEILITTLNTFHVNHTASLTPNENVAFECSIEKMPIADGIYTLGIQIMDLKERCVLYQNDIWDTLEIHNGDFFETGKIPNNKNVGSFLMDYQWVSKREKGNP